MQRSLKERRPQRLDGAVNQNVICHAHSLEKRPKQQSELFLNQVFW